MSEKKPEKKYSFKILIGIHQEGGNTYAAEDSSYHNNEDCAGSVIETDNDLEKHNGPGVIKFAKLDDSGRATVEIAQVNKPDEDGNFNLTKMTVPQLKQFASEHEIELEDGMKKDEIISWVMENLE